MKKLITLLLVLAGIVSTASATEVTVYFHPNTNYWNKDNAIFKIAVSANNTTEYGSCEQLSMTQIGETGIYYATFDNSTYSYFKFLRYSNDGNTVWNNHDTWTTAPERNTYYSINGYYEDNGNKLNLSISYCVIAGDMDITNNSESWNATSTVNAMEVTSATTYQLTVPSKLLIKGKTYSYKYVNTGTWQNDPNSTITVDADGFYNITYTFNSSSSTVSASPALIEEATCRYYVEEFVNSNITELGEMEVGASYVSFTITNKSLTEGEDTYTYKIKRMATGSTLNKEDWLGGSVGSEGCLGYSPSKTGSHTMTFIYYPSSASASIIANYLATNYYFIGGSGSWSINQNNPLVATDGVYSITVSNKGGHTFAILPDHAFTDETTIGEGNWKYAIRPYTDANVDITFAQKSGLIQLGGSINWAIANDYADYVTYSFTPVTNTWSVAPYRTATIGSACYATWSNGEKYKVSGAEAVYVVSANNTTSVTLTEKDADTVFPADEGIIVKGSEGDVVKFLAVASDASASTIGTNYLVGTGNSAKNVTATDYTYVFANDATHGVGFYKASESGTLAAHKAYLDLSRSSFNAPNFLAFDFGETPTGIHTVHGAELKVNGSVYNLNGQRVANPTKGLYIVNGRKVVLK